ncbi:hypothetical protein GCM10018793_35130 [Streptomyces sulfonofaciens]|uniref:Knr4/Smi1-like domain-containing protein n=1 Tax=Streptomyces sulfonofaciens TaxID=68272 RepID=A0A919L1U7_9ACTN|nr:SMI1/KNR4 family protein [Streptomyces sulfonofaciens]GHH80289.1 hypothetical protein GCM10018793_35130 [Streptomyces sulfonofaciens]
MQPIYADFTATPAKLGNMTPSHEGGEQRDGHLALFADGFVELGFDLEAEDADGGATLCFTSWVPVDDEPWGYLQVAVLLNGETLFDAVIVSQNPTPSDMRLGVPADRLLPGRNTLRLHLLPDAPGTLMLHRITLDAAGEPGRSLRALTEAGAPPSVFTFDTRSRADDGTWRAGRPVLVHLDREGPVELGQLSWRNADGSEASVAFQSGMSEFYGHHRAADGGLAEYHGRLTSGRVFPTGTEGAVVHRFHTQEGYGGGWHASGGLRLLVEDGTGGATRITWRDQRQETGSIALRMPPPDAGRGEVTRLVTEVRADLENRPAGEIAENLLDGPEHGKWLAFGGRAVLLFSFDRRVTVRHYVLVSANDCPERDPREWSLEGSDDMRSWTVLDSRTGVFFTERHQPRGFTFLGGPAFRHLRVRISRTGGHEVQLAQVRFFEAASPALGFTGFYQRPGEGPIGYRGTAAETAADRAAGASSDAVQGAFTGLPMSPFVHRTASAATAPTAAVPALPAQPLTAAAAVVPAAAPAVPAAESAPAGPATDPRLTTVEGWRAFLAEYSADFLRVADENERFNITDEQAARGWLGFEGASEADIAALERRLGTALPPSYRAFLAASDGWHQLGSSMWEMRTAGEVDWFRDADEETCEVLGEEDDELAALVNRALLVSREGDAQYWLLDPGTVSPDGEWAACTWSSWGFLSEEYPSFAALVVEERELCEGLWGREGRPVRTEGADELLAEGRALALRGEAEAARAAFDRAVVRGSGVGLYLKAILSAFLDLRTAHHTLRSDVLSLPHVRDAVGAERMRAEAVPLFLRASEADPGARPEHYLPMVKDFLPETGTGSPDGAGAREYWLARRAAFAPPVRTGPEAFERCLAHARQHAAAGEHEAAWRAVRHALSHWDSADPHSIAPVVLLTDPAFRDVVTERRARLIALTPRGAGSAAVTGG